VLKRIFDIAVSVFFLVLTLPLALIVAALVYWRLGSPVLLRQLRPGLHGRLFTLYKFRSMTQQCDESGNLLPDARRLTRFGRFLRATSFDELPELWNVIRGDMSLVGPRPLLPEYLPLYTAGQARRHEVLPGITGWAQVNGRNTLSWDDNFALDVWYVDNRSFRLDLKILLLTLWKVVSREGISQQGHVTRERFDGK
jgi:lipopolysaccharide/colanic/teichoic acid biosynthesis glycosyltransferase